VTIPFNLVEVLTFISELAMQILARIDIFRKDNITLEIKAKADMLALLAYLGKGDLCDKPWVP
jgi:hypothetical protein